MAVLEVVDQVAERHPGPDENGRTAEDFRITVDDSGMLTHVLPRYTSIEPLSPLSAYLLTSRGRSQFDDRRPHRSVGSGSSRASARGLPLDELLRDAGVHRVGTVDKFQGQEAAVVV